MKRKIFITIVVLAILALAAYIAKPYLEKAYYRVEYEQYIQDAANTYNVNPYWIIAMAKCESDFSPEATSSAGAVGVMQILPSTAQDIANKNLVDTTKYDPNNLRDPETNIHYGTAYMRYLIERYHEINPAIAAYNAGMGNVDKWLQNNQDVRRSVEFEETERYIGVVNKAKEKYEELYPNLFEWEH